MKRLILPVILFLSVCSGAFAQGFNSIHSNDGQNIIAAGNSGKIFKSSNGAITWASFTFNNTVNYKSVFSTGLTFYLVGSNGNIFSSPFGNLNITEYQTGNSAPLNSVFFVNTNTGFVCGNEGRVLKTTNGGQNWNSSNAGIGNTNLNSISFKDALNGIIAADSGKVYLTTNGGVNWTIQNTGSLRNLIKAKYFQTGFGVVGEYGFIAIKPDGGSWSLPSTRIDSDIRGISGTSITNIHVCGGGGFIRNNRNGSTNFFNFEENPMMANLVDIIYTDSLTGYAVSSLNYAVIKTTNAGLNWFLTAGTTATISWSQKLTSTGGIGNNLCMHPFDRNTMFVMYGNKVYVSRNRGDNWVQIATTPGTAAHSFYVSPLDTNIWVCATESSTDMVMRTTNYGLNWTTVLSKNFSNYGQPLEMDQNNPSVYYFAPDGGGYYKSTDNGATFTEISNNYPFRSPCDLIIMYDSSNVQFVADGTTGSGVGDIFKTSNGGLNWVKVHTNPSSSEIPSMCNTVFDKSIMYATNWSGGNIYKTSNFGDNWSLLRTNSSSGWASDICKEDPTVVMTGSYGSNTFISTNSGANFTTVVAGGGAGAGMLAQGRDFMIVMQTGAIYKLHVTYSVITSNGNENILTNSPSKYSLEQNFPNPFNPVTQISFEIPEKSQVSLKIFDITGKEIDMLINDTKEAGRYTVNWNASGYPTGVYFYRLQSRNFTSTKKMTLIK